MLMSAVCVLAVIASVYLLAGWYPRSKCPRMVIEVGTFVSPSPILSRNLCRCHLCRRGLCITVVRRRVALVTTQARCDLEIFTFVKFIDALR